VVGFSRSRNSLSGSLSRWEGSRCQTRSTVIRRESGSSGLRRRWRGRAHRHHSLGDVDRGGNQQLTVGTALQASPPGPPSWVSFLAGVALDRDR
jgi:hypothetical protein